MPTCPRCGFVTGALYKCDKCGDVRCKGNNTRGIQGACATSKGPGHPAIPNGVCWVCRKGRYRSIK